MADYVSPFDATVVKQLKDAGAIIVGKTNMDEFGMGCASDPTSYSPPAGTNTAGQLALNLLDPRPRAQARRVAGAAALGWRQLGR